MNLNHKTRVMGACLAFFLLTSCLKQPAATSRDSSAHGLKVIAVESFLANIAQNVAGEAVTVESLIPASLDPHTYQLTPADLARIADSDVLIINGAGLESWLADSLDSVGGQRQVIVASKGLRSRQMGASEFSEHPGEERAPDPHFWLDPILVEQYVLNIRDGFSTVDPAGREGYEQNTDAYIRELGKLDAWIRYQVSQIPPEKRILVTNHESLSYFADRYSFTILGAIIPSVSSDASPSAKHLAQLIDLIRQSGAKAIFLETGANPKLAEQIAAETGVRVVVGLSSHSLLVDGNQAATYIDMMKHNVELIVGALK